MKKREGANRVCKFFALQIFGFYFPESHNLGKELANERVKVKDLEEKNKDLGGQVRVCFLGT